ncbi:BnaC02g17630D [Brassica napus]|uniref:BnaC02g17630D protein n=5 Tax=Brassica TaxID=3705 RepID=A0A078H1P8_BRANA|nr:BnaC02g17630D [Brassica napus]
MFSDMSSAPNGVSEYICVCIDETP